MAGDQTCIDRRSAGRTVPMRVLCLGCGRTGTDSMCTALKMLGYNDCYHGYSCVLENPSDNYFWNEVMDAKQTGKLKQYTSKDWDALLGNCQAVSDLPCIAFAPELLHAYPDAKVILTEPPAGVDHWYESTLKTIMCLKEDWRREIWSWVNNEHYITRRTYIRVFDMFFEGDFRKHGRRKMREHHDLVRRIVPKVHLLEYNVKEGWEPLCKFLEQPIPKQEFPNGNDPQDFFKRFAAADWRRRKQTMRKFGITLAVAGLLVWQFM